MGVLFLSLPVTLSPDFCLKWVIISVSLCFTLNLVTTVDRTKIILVSNTSWSFVKFRMTLIKVLLDNGHLVLLLAPEDEETPQLRASGARYIPLHHLQAKGLNPLSDIAFARELSAIFKAERPDLIIHYTIKPNVYGSFAARKLGIPHISVVTGLGYTFIRGGWMTRVTSWMYRRAFKSASNIWFLNNEDRDLFVSLGLVDIRKTLVLPGEGIDAIGHFNPGSVQITHDDKDSGGKKAIRFVFVARLLFDKGITEYVAAARMLKEKYRDITVDFNVLGYLNVNNPSAVKEEQLRDWVASGIIRYLGHVDDVRPILLSQDCVVLPSYREGMSTTLMEAAALERPLIASDVAGCRELIDDGVNGFLCAAKDPSDLAEKMERFMLLPKGKQSEMGAAGREKMLAEFADTKVHQIYLDYVNHINGVTGERLKR